MKFEAVWNATAAERYLAYTKEYGMYARTNERLVDLAAATLGMAVADIGCGTGLTTKAILAKLGESGAFGRLMSLPRCSRLPAHNYSRNKSPLSKWKQVR